MASLIANSPVCCKSPVTTATAVKPAALLPFNSHLNGILLSHSSFYSSGFRDSRFCLLKFHHNSLRNTYALPVTKAQSSPEHVPNANFYKVEAIIRPWRVSQVSSALLQMGIRGVTVSDVRGFGAQGGSTERHGGSEFSEDKLIAKVKIEIVVSKDQVQSVIDKIIEEARTGEIGDGKIFLVPISDVIRVRTGERGEMAERMIGGRAEMSAASPAI